MINRVSGKQQSRRRRAVKLQLAKVVNLVGLMQQMIGTRLLYTLMKGRKTGARGAAAEVDHRGCAAVDTMTLGGGVEERDTRMRGTWMKEDQGGGAPTALAEAVAGLDEGAADQGLGLISLGIRVVSFLA